MNVWFQNNRLLSRRVVDKHILFCWTNYVIVLFDKLVYFERCGRRSLVETSTKLRHLVEVSTKLRHPKCRNFDHTSTKLRPNFDTPSVEVWSKFARYINELHCKFDKQMSTKLRHQTSPKLRPNFDQTSTKLRPSFDQTSTLGVSKFGRNFDQTSTPQCRSLV